MTSFLNRALPFVLGLWLITVYAIAQQAPSLGAFYDYNVVGGDRVFNQNNTNTVVRAKVASVSKVAQGFNQGAVWRGIDNMNAAANGALAAATSVFNTASAATPTTTLTNPELGGRAYSPGVYLFNGNATVANDITLDGGNSSDAVFIFIIKGSLGISGGVDIELIRDAKIGNVFWVVDNTITVGNGAEIKGQYLAKQAVTIGDGTIVRGRVASLQGEVRLNNNNFFLPTDLEIRIQKSEGNAGVDRYIVGQTITYTFTATNKGPVDDENVRVSPIFFSGVITSNNSDAPNSSFSLVNNNWVWNIGSLKVGESYTLILTATINETGPGFVRATISGAAEDELQDNNSRDINFCAVLPDAGIITGPVELCVGNQAEYSIESVVGATGYTWNVPSGWEIIGPRNTTKIVVKATARNDDAFIQVSVNNSCGASPPSRLKVNNYPDPPATPGPIKADEGVCVGESVTYSIEPVQDATNYIWTIPTGWNLVSGQGTTQITVRVGEGAGKVSVIAENVCGKSPNASELDVKPFLQQPQQPSSLSGNSQMTVCFNEDRVTFSVRASADVAEYVWQNWPAAWTLIGGQGTNSITFNPNGTPGEVTINGINPCGSSDLKFVLHILPDQPVVPGDISGAFPVCKGSVGTKYSIPEVPNATEYNWAVPNGWRITAGQGTREITVNLDPDAESGEISVSVINECGLEGRTKRNVEATTATPIAPTSIAGDPFTCVTTEVYYSTNTVPGAQAYIWEVPAGWQILDGQGTTRIKVKFGTTEGDIKVSAENSCGTSDPAVLRVKPFSPIPNIPFVITGPGSVVCENQTNVVFQLDPVDQAQKYTWSFPTGWRIVSGQGTNRIVVDVSKTSGTIRVTAENPCGESPAATLIVNLQPDIPAPKPGPITGPTQYCAGKEQTYSISPVAGAVAYQWTFPGADWVVIGAANGTTVTVRAGTTQGEVKVAAINNCGSVGVSNTLALQFVGQVPPAPAAIIADTESYCGNATNLGFRIDAVPTATSYIWTVPTGWTVTSGAGTNQIKVTAGVNGGDITVKAVNSCGESQSVKIVTAPQRALLNPEQISGPDLACVGRTDAVYSIPAIDGAETYLWVLPSGWQILEGAGTNRITVKVADRGDLKVSARNACGTTAEVKKTIEVVRAAPLAPAAITGETLTCATRTATYSIAPVENASQYNWTVPTGWTIVDGQGTTQITVQMGTNSGDIRVEAENDCNKSASTALAVTTRPLPVISRIIDRTAACSDIATFELESSTPAAEFVWEVPAGWEIISGQGTSVITVMQGNAKGDITVVADNGECKSDPVSIYSDPSLREAALDVPNVFTPNNDGNNDTWIIGNLENYPSNEVVVVNRWGNEVYRAKSYQNNWNGDRLAEGTYFYVMTLTLCDGTEKSYKGYVMIVR